MTRPRLKNIARMARIGAALLVLAATAFGFLAAGEAAEAASRVVASWQLFPATERAIGLAFGIAAGAGVMTAVAAIAILLMSFLFGRWYCAALCPLGVLQDLASLLRWKPRAYRTPNNSMRVVAALAAVGLSLVGATSLASWIEPWSIVGRFFTYDVQPLARLAARADIPGIGPWLVGFAAVSMVSILAVTVFRGRWFCGNLCPVGLVLGILNRFAPFRLRLDSDACVFCGRCASVCGASCIDTEARNLDATRCVYCLDCLPLCPTGAIRYGRGAGASPRFPVADEAGPIREFPRLSRAEFLKTLGGVAALSLAAWYGRGLASRLLERFVDRERSRPVTPPGSRSFARFIESCTACGLCVARCPSKVLQPSFGQLGARGLLAPRLDYEISYCQFDCVVCMEACPSGALEKIGLEGKRLTKVGDAALVRDRCIVFTNKTKCGACAEHCPTGAVRMVESPTGIPEPVFTSSICIGCGACHHACPVRPERAISVTGLAVHGVAQRPSADLFSIDRQFSNTGSSGDANSKTEEFPF